MLDSFLFPTPIHWGLAAGRPDRLAGDRECTQLNQPNDGLGQPQRAEPGSAAADRAPKRLARRLIVGLLTSRNLVRRYPTFCGRLADWRACNRSPVSPPLLPSKVCLLPCGLAFLCQSFRSGPSVLNVAACAPAQSLIRPCAHSPTRPRRNERNVCDVIRACMCYFPCSACFPRPAEPK